MEYEECMTIGSRIKALRERRGWSQADLAREAGITSSVIGKLETNPDRGTRCLPQIARALGVEPGELDPDYAPRAKIVVGESRLAARSADDWSLRVHAAVDEAFRLAGYSETISARIASEIQAAVDAPLRVPVGMTAQDVVRRVVRWELMELLRVERSK